MNLQDQIDSFQKMIFAHFRHSANNECRISALVPLVKESWGIYRFITSMLRAMHRSMTFVLGQRYLSADTRYTGTNDPEALEPLRQRYSAQHYALRKFYYECSNLKYLTSLINVPKLGQVRKLYCTEELLLSQCLRIHRTYLTMVRLQTFLHDLPLQRQSKHLRLHLLSHLPTLPSKLEC